MRGALFTEAPLMGLLPTRASESEGMVMVLDFKIAES